MLREQLSGLRLRARLDSVPAALATKQAKTMHMLVYLARMFDRRIFPLLPFHLAVGDPEGPLKYSRKGTPLAVVGTIDDR